MINRLNILTVVFCFLFYFGHASPTKEIRADVCIYTATGSGILAALADQREGKSVVIVEPGKWVGGILGAGIKPIQDCPNFDAVGGTTRELMKVLGMKGKSGDDSGSELRKAMRQISPLDIRNDFLAVLKKHNIRVLYDHRIGRTEKKGTDITAAWFDLAPFDQRGLPPAQAERKENLVVHALVYIDASYDGELMARSAVSYRFGRENAQDFAEDLAGVREATNLTPIDPYIMKGQKETGLLPLLNTDHGFGIGSGDYYTQAYNFRFYVTADSQYKISFARPQNYDPSQFELVGRYAEYLVGLIADREKLTKSLQDIFPGWMNAGEYNYQRDALITMAPVGVSHLYINGDYATKRDIWQWTCNSLLDIFFKQASERCKNRIPVEQEFGNSSLNAFAADCTSPRYTRRWTTGLRPGSENQYGSPIHF